MSKPEMDMQIRGQHVYGTRNLAIADKPRDALRGRPRSPNVVPFHTLGVRVRESRTLQLYHQPTFDDNKSHQLRRSNIPSFKNFLSRCRKQIPSSSSCHVIAIRLSTFTVTCGSKTSFFPCK